MKDPEFQPLRSEQQALEKTATCVRYGFCTSTCPTYLLSGDENESPRGRIALIQNMLETDAIPDQKTVRHIDSCLSCLSCETSCAASVHYRTIIDAGRACIEKNYSRPLATRLMRKALVAILPHPGRLRAALAIAKPGRLFARFLPPPLKTMLSLLPKGEVAAAKLRKIHPADGVRKGRIILHSGCIQQVIAERINQATIRLLTRLGYDVLENQSAECCGALAHHMGFEPQAQARAGQSLTIWADEMAGGDIDAIIVTASGCGTTLKHFDELFDDDRQPLARTLSAKVCDITEFINRKSELKATIPPGLRVAYHDACSLRNAQKITRPPRRLLQQVGCDLVAIPEAHFCCGSAGVYNILQPDRASELGQRKAQNATNARPDVIVAGNLGCLVQIGQYSETPLLHTVELLDWATGGPRPDALADLTYTPQDRPAPPHDPGQLLSAEDFEKKAGYQW